MFLNVSNEPTRIILWLTTFIILNLAYYKKASIEHSPIKYYYWQYSSKDILFFTMTTIHFFRINKRFWILILFINFVLCIVYEG